MHIRAPAKINLYLHLTGRRNDGYHFLDSLACFVDLFDQIDIAPADALQVSVTGRFAPSLVDETDNILARAARAMADAGGFEPNIHIQLTKAIPVAAGLGGGSSDAAALLRALNGYWQLSLDDAALGEIGLTLGADLPVCLAGRAAWMGGIGEHIRFCESTLPALAVVLVNPRIGLSTAAVYRARQGAFGEADRLEIIAQDSFLAELGKRRNDLEQPALRLAPKVGEVLAALRAKPGCGLARMSGSGATCFGLFEDTALAQAAASELVDEHADWWVHTGQIIDQAPDLGT